MLPLSGLPGPPPMPTCPAPPPVVPPFPPMFLLPPMLSCPAAPAKGARVWEYMAWPCTHVLGELLQIHV